MSGQIIKKRILIPIVGQGSVTHIIRTGMLDKLKEFCEPVVAFLWHQEDLIAELHGNGYEVYLLPSYKVTAEYSSLKSKINIWYLNYKLKTPSVNIQEKYLEQFKKVEFSKKLKKQTREIFYKLRFNVQPSYAGQLISKEKEAIITQACYSEYKKWLKHLNIDGLFTVTPFLSEIDLIARILREEQKPIIASIHSFDNVTKRGWQSTVFDHYIVWNKYNKAELERIFEQLQTPGSITVAGAPQFDFHFNKDYCWTKEDWLKKLSIPANKKVILYGGGPVSLLPDEPQYLKALKDALEEGKIAKDTVVLFRCHPLDKVERWKEYVGDSRCVIYDSAPHGTKKLDHANVSEEDIRKLMSTLKYADIHINVVSTMAVDGSAFLKPQIGPYYDEVRSSKQHLLRSMYSQEHYIPIIKSKAVHLPGNKVEYISVVNNALENPAAFTKHCKDCIKEIITYADGQSANRAVAAIKNFFEA